MTRDLIVLHNAYVGTLIGPQLLVYTNRKSLVPDRTVLTLSDL